jgi:hypothetical protein
MTALRPSSASWPRVRLTLAVLALVLKVAIPAGYMVDARAGGAPAIVLCTAQGAVTIAAHDDHNKAPAKSTHDAPCAFAGHGAAFVAAEPATLALVEHAVYAPALLASVAEAVPGRGLSAPPLPARGPPQAA